MIKYLILFFTLSVLFWACTSQQDNSNADPIQQEEIVISSFDIFPELKNIDSIEIIYYDNPYGDDSLKYARYYTYVATNDTGFSADLKTMLGEEPIKSTVLKPCRSEGKLYTYGEKGKEIKTIFFALNNPDSTCNRFYYIHNGIYYSYSSNYPLTNFIEKQKLNAKKPD